MTTCYAVVNAGTHLVVQHGIVSADTTQIEAALIAAMGGAAISQTEYDQILAVGGPATLSSGVVAAVPPAPLSLAQQAAMLLSGGLTITSVGTPAINGTYGCSDADQARFNRMFSAIQKAGGNAWPAGIASLVWPLKGAAPVTFTSVATFLEVALAVEAFVIACDQIMVTGTGPLPASAVTIA